MTDSFGFELTNKHFTLYIFLQSAMGSAVKKSYEALLI